MTPQQTPEIRRVPLESLFLQAKAMDEDTDVKAYLGEAIDPPNVGSMEQALRTLVEVGAIQQDRGFKSRLTALGRHLVRGLLGKMDIRIACTDEHSGIDDVYRRATSHWICAWANCSS